MRFIKRRNLRMNKNLRFSVYQFACAHYDAEREIFQLHGELRNRLTNDRPNVSSAADVILTLRNGRCFSHLLESFPPCYWSN
jgi:hypothetical protein